MRVSQKQTDSTWGRTTGWARYTTQGGAGTQRRLTTWG